MTCIRARVGQVWRSRHAAVEISRYTPDLLTRGCGECESLLILLGVARLSTGCIDRVLGSWAEIGPTPYIRDSHSSHDEHVGLPCLG